MGTWVDLSKELPGGSTSPARTTPVPFGGESDYMRMLREAQVPDHYFHKNLCLPSSSSLSSGNCPGLHNSDSCTHFLNQKEKAQINITFFLAAPLRKDKLYFSHLIFQPFFLYSSAVQLQTRLQFVCYVCILSVLLPSSVCISSSLAYELLAIV